MILKKTQALTANENPKLSAMKSNWLGSLGVPTTLGPLGEESKATCVPENAKKRNNVVPANSALVATK